jgi:hypothetical protein
MSLLFIFGIITARNAVIAHFIRVLGGRNNAQVILQLLLFQVTLGQVLQLTLAKVQLGRTGNRQLGAVTANDNIAACQLSSLAVNLDAIVQVLFKLCDIQDLIVNGLRAVNHKLDGAFLTSLDLLVRIIVEEKTK